MIRHYFLLLLLLISSSVFSQKIDLTESSPWFISPNVGGTWHTTDVRTMVNAGGGFTLGRSYMKKNVSPVWLDFYGRFLTGTWKGQDIKSSDLTNYSGVLAEGNTNYKALYNYTVHNFRTKNAEINLELALHFNRIVHNTGWDPYIFGGVGMSFYRAYGNYMSDNYPYLFDHSYGSNSQVLATMDNSYETPLDGNKSSNTILAGHLGVGIGYYITPRFSIGLEHKTTFTGKDNFDGLLTSDKKSGGDIYHYSSIYLKWYFKGKSSRNPQTNPPVVTPPVVTNPEVKPPVVTPPVVKPPCDKPKVDIQNANNQSTSDKVFNLQAFISNANSNQTFVTLNGTTVSNVSFQNNGRLISQLNLYEGLNTITIKVVNECGQETKSIFIQHTPLCDEPIVSFDNIRQTRVSSTTQQYNYSAEIRNIQRGNLIQVYVNGSQQSNFNLNYNTNQIAGVAQLQNGNNIIQIVATNNCGSTSQVLNVEYNSYCPTPVIQFTNVSTSVSQQRYPINFNILQINSINQVVVKLNGIIQNDWFIQQINGGLNLSKALTLVAGVNKITVTATNSCGTENETVQVIYNEPCKPATITLTAPRSTNFTTSNTLLQLQATITDVNENSAITLFINGVRTTGFTYNTVTDLFRANVNLLEGNNRIQIIAKNDCSTVTENLNVQYSKPCEVPNVNITSPMNNVTFENPNTTIVATVYNVITANQIAVYINGNLIRNHSLAGNRLTIPCVLAVGNNNIQIVVTNECGSNTQTVNVTYSHPKPQVAPPVVTFSNECNIKIEPSSNTFYGNIVGVTTPSQVSILVNGQPYSNITWNYINDGLNFSFNLRTGNEGIYTVTIIATNQGGSSSKTCTLTVVNDPIINICFQGQNISIKESQWIDYRARGALRGKCPEIAPPITISKLDICLDNVTVTILESQWPAYSARGAVRGKCPEVIDNEIVICVLENDKYVSKKIKESQWESYKRVGATLGECPVVVDNDIVICLNMKTMTIKESKWSQYVRLGATLGECPKEDPIITICHRVGSTLTTLKIKQSEWPNYQALGATLGECPIVIDPEILICIKTINGNTTQKIKQSEWVKYQAVGATLGACADTSITIESPGNGGIGTINNGMLICVFEDGKYVTKNIKPIQWPSYEARGAIRGACTGNEQRKVEPVDTGEIQNKKPEKAVDVAPTKPNSSFGGRIPTTEIKNNEINNQNRRGEIPQNKTPQNTNSENTNARPSGGLNTRRP